MAIKRQSEYSPVEWASLFPEQRYAAKQAEDDHAMGRAAIPTRAADGRSVIYIDPVTRAPVPNPKSQLRRMG
jgi:hypothetical protein